ncbi:MAG: tetratricopeptide repeat-containing sulfotransferase family protein, partial [Pseudomonadales bacterium]
MANNPTNASIQSLQAILQRGFKALSRGEIREASECCKEVLRLKPDLVQGHFLVGLVALEAKDRKTAFSAFRSVTKLQKTHAAAWAQLAKLFMSEGQVNRADAALQQVVKNDSKDPMVQDLLGTIYSMMGDYGLARSWFAKANNGQPNHPPFMLNLANNLVYHGDLAAAEKIFHDIIDIQPHSPQAHWHLASSQKVETTDHIGQLKRLIAQKGQHPRALAFYHYGVGKEYEDLQEWDLAFAAISEGAKARRQTVEYDEAAEIAMFEFLQRHFTRDWFDAKTDGHKDAAPIFVLGQPRTGTTLVERIISSHSQVHSAGELQQFSLAIRRLSNHQNPKRFSAELFDAALALDSKKIGTMYMETTRRMQGGTPHFVDKLPQNYLFIPLILKALPNAKIVHLTRDPMDACFASYKQLFADAYLHSYDQEEMARHHARYRHLMEIWR